MYRDIPEELKGLIEPVVEEHGLELMNVETMRGPGAAIMRITVDTHEGDGRVPVDLLAAVSREVETQLDAAGTLQGSYRLEVSSPGLDRMLAREKDFVAACGAEIKVRTRRPLAGRRNFRGQLVSFRDGIARVVVDGEERGVPFEEVEKANTIYTFSSEDFRGGSSRRAAK